MPTTIETLLISTLAIAFVLFASTNVDDIFVLLSFFADRKYQARQVVVGQYLGVGVLVAVSIVASLVSLVLSPEYVGLLGILPILIGLKRLYDLSKGRGDVDADVPRAGLGNVMAVAAVTIANGGDNIGIYTPVFATSTWAEIVTYVVVFALMIAVWLGFSHWLVHHKSLGQPIRHFGPVLVPFVLIAIGIFVLYDAKSFSLIGL